MKKLSVMLVVLIFLAFANVSLTQASINSAQTISSVVLIQAYFSETEGVSGSGFFISSDGFILTNSHVVINEETKEPSSEIYICTVEDEYSQPVCKYMAAVVSYDTTLDLALLVIAGEINESGELVQEFQNFDEINVSNYVDFGDNLPGLSDNIMILGFPDASLTSTVTLTKGVVSGFEYYPSQNIIWYFTTDAIINPGNSGGPAYNDDEKVIGVSTAVSTEGIGGNYGLIISNDIISAWFNTLVETGVLNAEYVENIFNNDETVILESDDGDYSYCEVYGDYSYYDKETDSCYCEEGYEFDERDHCVPVYDTLVKPFKDITGANTYFNAITFVKSSNIVKGYEDGTYQADKTINRAEFSKILIESAFKDEIEGYQGSACFSDVKSEDWFAKYVCFAKEKGIIAGYEDLTFKPNQEINIAEALKITLETYYENIPDSEGEWYQKYWDFAINEKLLISQWSSISDILTRGEMAELIFRINY